MTGIRRRLHGFCIALMLMAGGAAAQERMISLDALRVAGTQAALQGDLATATEIAQLLIGADPDDSFGHYLMGMVLFRQGQGGPALQAARLSYRHAQTPVQRHQSARLATGAAVQANAPLRASFWLRRAVETAPDAPTRADSLRALNRMRAKARWRGAVRFQISPSSNINGGSDSRYNVIDGLPFTGVLSNAAQALPGTVATMDLEMGRLLRRTERAEIWLDGRVYLKDAHLSGAAKQKAPELAGDALDSATLELSLAGRHALNRGWIDLDLDAGKVWYGGAPYYRFATAGLARDLPLGRNDRLTLSAAFERRWSDLADSDDQIIRSARLSWRHGFANGDRVSAHLGWQEADAARGNLRHDSGSAQLVYAPARQLGPLSGSLTLGAMLTDYPAYTVIFTVPGGRHDETLYLDLDLWAADRSFAGFSPSLKLRALQARSNVSRFTYDDLSVGFGLRQAF